MAETPFRAIIKHSPQSLGGNTAAKPFDVLVRSKAKPGLATRGYEVANEFIVGRLADFIGLPMPHYGVIKVERHTSQLDLYASLDFAPGRSVPPVTDVSGCFQALPRLCTGVLVFDILVANPDRHCGNISVDMVSHKMYVFDHGRSLFGNYDTVGIPRLAQLRDRLGCSGSGVTGQNRHMFLDAIPDDLYFGEWIDRVKGLPNYVIEDTCNYPYDLGVTKTERTAAMDFLCYRRDNIEKIIHTHQGEFTAIKQWRLSLPTPPARQMGQAINPPGVQP